MRRVFECKTCNRKFPTFQALGGHRTGHRKPRLLGYGLGMARIAPAVQAKPKVHECAVCGLAFAIGQALGGHMRRHKNIAETRVPGQDHQEHSDGIRLDLKLSPPENDMGFLMLRREF